ncbi:L-histidine N(alpha)-methyltransferase [Alkalilimnicola ehrlichii]|uniref:L-histidine N(Alpha)-methyltransferase n=1 Tax=Alkalilimnicola ehrlichii TaxID=351052 RepID=A0A3E0X121_9GAMM|nr:L-histidine N(alpha)-methyltransferase [Alkalilimnicola ehrlichii]RFA30372.1 L-histidine N(alpha)-methyltransferase [Alkalilimnicola ehrlichii]RFA37945.1 L-histidine N(alpha)-methyltransferase [Alkalilimnicola ehrlichii]
MYPAAAGAAAVEYGGEVAGGLSASPRSVPSKYFYDARGSVLFDRICHTPEYYPTRTEDRLLAESAASIVHYARPEHIIELGSGTSRKTRHLFDACEKAEQAVHYWPLDVCAEMLTDAGLALLADYPWLSITALEADYLAGLDALPVAAGRRLFVFLGGTLGNFEQQQAACFLRELRGLMAPDDYLLLGLDRVKEPSVLKAAYNDAAGVTAEFNLNMLHVLNRELGADFPVDRFRHRAVYNRQAERIEMYLIATKAVAVSVAALGGVYRFEPGDRLLTEISQKYSGERLAALMAEAGLAECAHFTPPNRYFSLLLLKAA